jgi:hypothetical protein
MSLPWDPTTPDWITACASGISALAVVIGLVFGWKQLTHWRDQERQKAKKVVAEEVMLSALQIKDVMDVARHALSSMPRDQSGNRHYDLDRRVKILQDNANYFASLRLAQFKARVWVFGNDVDEAINQLFNARSDFLNSIDLLADYADSPPTLRKKNSW